MIRKVLLATLALFLVPALGSVAVWAARDQPGSWRSADWSSSGLLAARGPADEAAIIVLAARTGGLKGALAVHSWIIHKRAGEAGWTRHDKVGWGSPIRRNGYAADGRWYSNDPVIVGAVSGPEAERLIPKLEAAIAAYPWASRGGYTIWPGPNSNSFVAHVLRAVPELAISLPPEAVGRDYLGPGFQARLDRDNGDMRISFGGYAGLAAGRTAGVELQVAGLVIGMGLAPFTLKLPGFGEIGF